MVETMVNDLEVPSIVRRDDGSFGVNYVLGVQEWYDKDGNPIPE
jgi:hypothetical protein